MAEKEVGIGVAAGLLGISVSKLRRLDEKIGLRCFRSENGYRKYRMADVLAAAKRIASSKLAEAQALESMWK